MQRLLRHGLRAGGETMERDTTGQVVHVELHCPAPRCAELIDTLPDFLAQGVDHNEEDVASHRSCVLVRCGRSERLGVVLLERGLRGKRVSRPRLFLDRCPDDFSPAEAGTGGSEGGSELPYRESGERIGKHDSGVDNGAIPSHDHCCVCVSEGDRLEPLGSSAFLT